MSTERCTTTGAMCSTLPAELASVYFGRGSVQPAAGIARGHMLIPVLLLLHTGGLC